MVPVDKMWPALPHLKYTVEFGLSFKLEDSTETIAKQPLRQLGSSMSGGREGWNC